MNKRQWLKKSVIILISLYPVLVLAATYGYVERIVLEQKLSLKAKLDTGARQSSLSATNLHIFKKAKQKMVSFKIPGIDRVFVRPFVRYVRIKARAGEKRKGLFTFGIKRPVVRLLVELGGRKKKITFNLTNRQSFTYPVLLGRDALIKFSAKVDPAQTFLHNPKLAL